MYLRVRYLAKEITGEVQIFVGQKSLDSCKSCSPVIWQLLAKSGIIIKCKKTNTKTPIYMEHRCSV